MAKHFNFVDIAELRYRKRYDLLQWQKNTSSWLSKPSYDTANGMICCNSGASGAPKIKASEGAFSKIRPKMGKIADFNRGHCFESA